MTIPRVHPDTTSLEPADMEINLLVRDLRDKNTCPCCVAWALAYHAATSGKHAMGTIEASEMLKDVMADVLKCDIPLRKHSPSAGMH